MYLRGDDMEKQGVIYKIENLVNGKVYVGQTVKSYERRIQVHFVKLEKHYHNNTHLQRAFNKYGKDNFKASIVATCAVDEIDEIEKYWIRNYKEKNMSYNIEDGGNYIKELTEETKSKISQQSKRCWADKEIRSKIMQNLKRGKDNYNSRAVICVTDMKVFDSMTEAAEYYGINMKAIYSAIANKHYCRSNKGKLEFYLYREGEEYKQKEPDKIIYPWSKKVICLTTGEIFDSVTHAAKTYKLETTNISKVCKGKQRSTGKLPNGTKLTWAYYDEHLSN